MLLCLLGISFITESFGHYTAGVDVSHHNVVDWEALADDQIEFCYIKLTEGMSFRDNKAATLFRNAKNHQLKVGYYPVVYYGNLNAYLFPALTRKCPGWYRTVYMPNAFWVNFQQRRIKRYPFGDIDYNTCRDLSKITVPTKAK